MRRRRVGALVTVLLIVAAALITCAVRDGTPTGGGERDAKNGGGARGTAAGRARSGRTRVPAPGDPVVGTRTADAARPGAAGPDATQAPATPVVATRPADVIARSVTGKVVDVATGDPIAGARVLLAVFDVERVVVPTGNWAAVTGAGGAFRVGPSEHDAPRRTLRVDVRAKAEGYLPATGPAEDGVVLRLERIVGPPPRGRVSGLATDADGRPYTGLVQVSAKDAVGDWHGLWAVARPDGSFTIDGLAAGAWSFALSGGESQEATVADGGDARVHLRAPAQKLDDRVAGKPTREVRITGLPRDAGTHVRLHLANASSMFFRAPAADGAVTFPAVPVGSWRIEVERAATSETGRTFDVPSGDGAFDVEAAPRTK